MLQGSLGLRPERMVSVVRRRGRGRRRSATGSAVQNEDEYKWNRDQRDYTTPRNQGNETMVYKSHARRVDTWLSSRLGAGTLRHRGHDLYYAMSCRKHVSCLALTSSTLSIDRCESPNSRRRCRHLTLWCGWMRQACWQHDRW